MLCKSLLCGLLHLKLHSMSVCPLRLPPRMMSYFAQPACTTASNLRTHQFVLGFPSLPARLGNVDWRMAASLAAGTAVGSLAGSNVAVAAPPGALEAAFCVGMLFLGRKTLATAR